MKINEATIRTLPANGRMVGDEKTPNLYVRKNKDGSAAFVYKSQRGGNWREQTLGKHPRMSLDRARSEAARLRAEDTGAVAMSWGDAAARYVSQKSGQVTAVPLRNIERALLTHFAELKSIKLDAINRQQVAKIVSAFSADKPETALKLLANAKSFTRWAAITGLVDRDPLDLLDRKTLFGSFKSNAKTRVLSDDEIRKLWADESYQGLVLWWQLLTACRVSEALQFSAKQVKGDIWIIPTPATKSRREHRVPLSTQAQTLLAEQEFPPPISYALVAQYCERHFDYRSHDCRRTAATRMRALGTSAETVHYVLNHARGILDATYLRHDPLPEARVALQLLGDHLDTVIS